MRVLDAVGLVALTALLEIALERERRALDRRARA
jgi:hypothetical protein